MKLTDPRFKWFPASSHSDPTPFRERMRERMKAAQAKQPATAGHSTEKEQDRMKLVLVGRRIALRDSISDVTIKTVQRR